MNEEKVHNKGVMALSATAAEKIEKKDIALFAICWFSYFFAYFGRMNYSACMAAIIVAEGYSKGMVGLVGTGLFITYGLGQIFSGFLGDYVAPRKMIVVGLIGSSLSNLMMCLAPSLNVMIFIWCINGFMQSLLWSPIVRLFAQYFTSQVRGTLGVYINSTVPVGTLATYGFTALILELTGNWKMVFFGSFIVVMITAVGWWFFTGMLLPKLTRVDVADITPVAKTQKQEVQKAPLGELVLSSGMVFMCLVLMMQGMLKEGITAWMPNLMGEKFEVGTTLAIVSTALIPMFNIIGISIAAVVRKMIGDEVRCSFFLFIAGTIALAILYSTSYIGLLPMFAFFSIATTIMMAVNTVYVGVVPGYFAKKGRSSSVSGILNAFVNLGIATSMFATGAFSEAFGWDMTMIFWCVCGGVGIFASFTGYQLWKNYKIRLES
jgi:OPA family glycerol-3-phosphate transporter-like MFS transporter